jgi:hypothetical protein
MVSHRDLTEKQLAVYQHIIQNLGDVAVHVYWQPTDTPERYIYHFYDYACHPTKEKRDELKLKWIDHYSEFYIANLLADIKDEDLEECCIVHTEECEE